MRSKLLLSLLFFATLTHAQDFKSPMDYLNYIGAESNIITQSTWKYTSAMAHSKSGRRIDATRKALVKNIQNASKKIAALKDGYKGDVEYRDQMLAYLSISEKQINQEYDKIIDMQEVAEQSYDFMEAYMLARDLINEKINAEVDKLNANQKAFGAKYGITITEDNSELGKKMRISNEVFENQTQLYLIFFKSSITESNMMNAIKANDLNAIQQNINALNQYSDEGLEKLKTFKSYKNDQSLVNATKKALEFYKKEATEFGPQVVSFLMMNQKVAENQKTLENKAAKDRTKEEIDSFNQLVKESNKGIDDYNKQSNKYNSERAVVINNWNETGEIFVSKHVPN